MAENSMYHTHISAKHRWMDLNLKEVWQYRDLIYLFTKRNFVVSYKQTILGPAWIFLTPLFTSIVQAFVFGGIAGIGTDGIPTFLFYLCSNAVWAYFANCLTSNANTFTANAYVFGKVYFPRLTKAEIDAKMEDIIEFSEVRDFIDTPVKRYSSGMFVKLAFSVAAHLDSEIMIMDEVLAVGDVNFQQKCLKKMREVAQVEGRTVLYVSHNMGTIRQLCDRCIVLDKGKIIFDGDVEDAIGVYAKGNMLALQSDYDVSKIKRLEGITEACHLNAVHLDCGSMAREKKLRFSLDYDSRREIPDVMLRFVLCSAGGAAVGTAYSQTFTLRPGESTVQLEFDGKNLAPGEYVADLITISYDGTTQTRHDIVVRAFAFTVEEDEPLYNMKWNTNGWGSIHFDDVRVLEGKNG